MRQRSRFVPQEHPFLERGVSASAAPRFTFAEAAQDATSFLGQVQVVSALGGQQEVMNDVVIPDFHARRKRGEILPTNNMSRSSYTMISQLFLAQASVHVLPENHHNRYMGYCLTGAIQLQAPGTRQLLSSSDVNSAKVEAIARLRQQGMDYLTSAAEFHKTVAMFLSLKRNLMASIEKVVRELKRRHRQKRFRTFNAIYDEFTKIWLEGRFGWRILLYDIEAITSYLRHMDDGTSFIVGRSSQRASTTENGSGRLGSYHSYSVETTYTDSVHVGYPGIVDHSILGNPSLLNTAWEVVPFSLVLDWFFDIQSMIFAFANTPKNVEELPASAFMTRKQTTVAVYNAINGQPSYVPLDNKTSGPVVLTREVSSRSLPGPYSLSLTWKPSISGLVWVDFLALMKPLYRLLTSVGR